MQDHGQASSEDGWQVGATSDAPSAKPTPSTPTTVKLVSSRSISDPMEQSCGSATTADGEAASPPISQEHAQRLRERGLNPILCAQLGVHTIDKGTIGFHYFLGGQIHNTKIRRGKGNMPWAQGGKTLIAYGIDDLTPPPAPDEELIITEGEFDRIAFKQCGFSRVISVPNGAQTGDHGFEWLYTGGQLHADIAKFSRYVLATDGDRKGLAARDALAIRLGDEKCRWIPWPRNTKDGNDVLKASGAEALSQLVYDARPMWTDEVATIDDIPEPPEEEPRYRCGIPELDAHGFRITLPALWVIVGPYSSGKSVLLRQVACNLRRLHGWKFMLTSFEERVKPRYMRDLRRHFIGRPMLPDQPWTPDEIAAADQEIRDGFVFLRRPRGKTMDPARVLDRIEYAVKVYGIKAIAIDPVNELHLKSGNGINKTEMLGEFIMQLKDLSEDYGLCVILCAHTTKNVLFEKARWKQKALLRLDDAEDTKYYGNKADIGWCVWRSPDKPTMLHLDKSKDWESMGASTLCELSMDRAMNSFSVARMGYGILSS